MRIILIALLILITIPSAYHGQDFIGIRQSNYSGVMGADLNPASIADNRMVVDVTLGALHFGGYNNHLYMNTRLMPYWWKESFSSDTTNIPAHEWQSDDHFGSLISADSTAYYTGINKGNFFEFENPKNKARKAFVNVNIDILNAMVSVSPKMSIGIQVKHRTFVNLDHLAPELLTLAQNSLEFPDLWDINLSDQLLNISANSWMEYNGMFAMVLKDDGEHFFKAGGKLKFLQGLGSFYMYTDEVKYNFLNGDTANAVNGIFNYGYSSNVDDFFDASTSTGSTPLGLSDVFKMVSKLGVGLDIGGVYEWRPNWEDYKYDMDGETNLWRRDQNKYKLRVGISLNDIGGMKYTKSEHSRNFQAHASVLDLAQFEDSDGLASFNDNLDTLVAAEGASFIDDKGTYYMNLPTHMNLNVDYHIWKDFYINANSVVSFQRNKNPHKVRYPSSVALTPRFDQKWFGVSLPLSYSELNGFRTGIALRAGPLVLGTGDMKPLIAPGKDKKIQGTDFFFAIRVPILYAKPKDEDLDKVSDKMDECKGLFGVWEFKGCPDTDGDGIKDVEDDCPADPGPKEFNGCPDTDGDKIIDKNDDCPEIAGLKEFNGCPDKDGDKIIDKEDDCPDTPGIAEFNGCPDRDGDGLKDSEDLCPEVAGPIENQGCPDTDNDGIFDYLDGCPTEAGPKENNGCPWPDTDKDGLLDKDDRCPQNAGPIENDGCPYTDTDGDGVLDKDDECVNTPGPVENKGCPEIKEEEQEILNTAFENLEFESGKNIIKEVSFPSLEELALLLIKKSEWKITIAGHTDDVGKAQTNLILSKKRSEAVRDFLVQRGVTTERVIVQYFGEDKPIADNETKEGRQKNRRVEMTIIFE